MAIFSHGSISYVFSLKVLLISTCVLSMAMAFKFSVPVISEIAVSDIPMLYSFVVSFLKPPYLYLVINCIIITIVATSKLQYYKLDDESPESVTSKIVVELQTDYAVESETEVYESLVSKRPEFEFYSYDSNLLKDDVIEPENHSVSEMEDAGKSSWTPPPIRQDSNEFLSTIVAKPPLSSRIGQRKSLKAGKALRVSKPKQQETLESAWKTITEGRPMPLTRHLKKSDTWETRQTSNSQPETGIATQKMKKSETFHDHTNTASNNNKNLPLRKEPSLNQDELNRRVEAFIKKFNEEMRMQRQESLNQYNEMLNRGAT